MSPSPLRFGLFSLCDLCGEPSCPNSPHHFFTFSKQMRPAHLGSSINQFLVTSLTHVSPTTPPSHLGTGSSSFSPSCDRGPPCGLSQYQKKHPEGQSGRATSRGAHVQESRSLVCSLRRRELPGFPVRGPGDWKTGSAHPRAKRQAKLPSIDQLFVKASCSTGICLQ